MEVIKPKVRTLASGKKLITKEMSGKEGKLLPLHLSNLESVIFIHEGECILNMADEEIQMKPGDCKVPQNPKSHVYN